MTKAQNNETLHQIINHANVLHNHFVDTFYSHHQIALSVLL